jgi:hypothetical protein
LHNGDNTYVRQSCKKNKIIADSKMAKYQFIKTDPTYEAFDKAYGYVIPMWVRQDLVWRRLVGRSMNAIP